MKSYELPLSKRKPLGKTNLMASPFGFGALQLTNLDLGSCKELIHRALYYGINWFDTARDYFASEYKLGCSLKGRREETILLTKTQKVDKDSLIKDLDTSLSELQTDYIDIYLFHKALPFIRNNEGVIEELLNQLEKEKKKGKIRSIGISSHRLENAMIALDYDTIDVAMIPFNFISTEFMDYDFISMAKKKDVAVLGMKPFGGGRIPDIKLCIDYLKKYQDISPCFGMKSISELESNMRYWNSETNDPMRTDDMDYYAKLLGKFYCRGCGYCMPCPNGINIPLIAFLKINMGQVPAVELFNKEMEEEVRKVKNCNRCGRCAAKCPFELDIPALIKENSSFYLKSNMDP